MDSAEYVFRSVWRVRAGPDEVYAALREVDKYPSWWPQVISTRRIDDVSGELCCRSLLPYDLRFTIHRVLEDPADRVLRARLTGDLAGTSQWTVSPDADGSVAVFDEQVDVAKRLLRLAGRVARPALRYNHDRMMRSGEKGLRRLLGA